MSGAPGHRRAGAPRPLISGNWKMNLNHLETIQVIQKLSYRLSPQVTAAVEVSVHPPFTDLRSAQTVLDADDMPIILGAQSCHFEDEGAFTGEVSAAMLAKLNVRYVIVGHSERRQLFGETDEVVNRKLLAVLRNHLTPILCVGETLDEREGGHAAARVTTQLEAALTGVDPGAVGQLVVAYEPVWAIGTGQTATPADAQEMCGLIRRLVGEWVSPAAARSLRVQYGGSVNTQSAAELLSQPDVDGALVGGASLDPDGFAVIVEQAATATR
jgi:triosephosphate isomerase (TIM)